MKFHQDHLDRLKCCISKEESYKWLSNMSPKNFADKVLIDGILPDSERDICIARFDEKKVDRCDVRKFVRRSDVNTLEKVLFVMAWGGMHIHNAKSALKSYSTCWEMIANKMLESNICKDEAYKQFHNLVKSKKLKNMGAAYFTKLIYFLESNHNGYIMDQWTARSMNLLRKCPDNQIHLTSNGRSHNGRYRKFRVSNNNDCAVYSEFCKDLEHLAEVLCKTPEETEILLFSNGGRLPDLGCWRRYVLEQTSFSKPK